jgi:hypothetical protein
MEEAILGLVFQRIKHGNQEDDFEDYQDEDRQKKRAIS